ncbi:MAG: BTAD domain-containing putative transcriptional regulator [Caldilineaceae bacterium]
MIKLYLLGGFRAEGLDSQPLVFATNKVRALLAFLAMNQDQLQTRQVLADLFWPTSTEGVALSNLRNTLARLRKSIGDPAWLIATRQGIQLVAEPHQLWTDTTAFDYLWQHLHNTATAQTLQTYLPALAGDEWERYRLHWMAEAAALYQGEFLAGLSWNDEGDGAFAQWQRQKREEYHTKVLALLAQLAEHALATNDYLAATDYARRQLALEPWRELAHRQLMLALVGSGDPGGALTQFTICRQTVWDELGIEPEAETTALYTQIQVERQLPPTSNSVQLLPHALQPAAAEPEAAVIPTPSTKPRHNLPTQLTPFIGRQAEVAQLETALRTTAYRLHVVVGMGGMGKSRLALQVAEMAVEHFDAGVFMVPLAEIKAVDEVVPAIARSLEIPLQDELPVHQQLVTFLQNRHLLLLLDSVEHLLDEGQPDTSTFVTLLLGLLHEAPQLVLLVTSRRQLQVRADNLFVLAGLAYPPQASTEALELTQFDAVQLFVERAQRVNKQFSLADEAAAVQAICALLEGMPLGIELAAAHAQHRTCTAILASIMQNLADLQSNFHDLPPRQQNLFAVFDFSWGLLACPQQELLMHCTIFQGSFTWADVCALMPHAVDTEMAELVAHCLVQQQSAGRYHLHALVQQCANPAQRVSSVKHKRTQATAPIF